MNKSTTVSNFLSNKEDIILILSLISITGIILAASFVEKVVALQINELLSIASTSFFTITVITLTIRTKEKNLKRSLFFLSLFAVFWLIAFQYWNVSEIINNENPFPSIADAFFIFGYVSIFIGFGILTFPQFKQISIDVKIIGTIISVFLLIPSIILTNPISEFVIVERVISLAYVIFDAVILWFTVILLLGISKNKPAGYFSFGILCMYIGDTIFSFEIISGTFYTGGLSYIFYYCGFVFLGFMAYNGLKRPETVQITDAAKSVKKINLPSRYRKILLSSITIVIGLISILILSDFKITVLTPNQEEVIIPMIYASLLFVVGSTISNLFFLKKEASLESRSWKNTSEESADASKEIIMLERQISLLESRSKKNSILTIVGIGILACVIVAYFALTITSNSELDLTTGKFLIENLKGDKISTWVTWRISQNQILLVTIINSPGLSDQRIKIVEEAIVSEKSTVLANSFMNKEPPNEKSTYYEGWVGALKTGAKQKTKFSIPTNFVVNTSTKSTGNIILILSTAKESDNTYGFTRTIADEGSNQILKSFITIYNVDDLNALELSAIVRHEFGHAMGLAHSTDSKDLMYPVFSSNQAVISECDIDALISLYNGKTSTDVVCRH